MRHRKAGLKLSRTTSHLNAMFRNLVTSLFKHDRIRTTDTKARELRRWADHIVTLAKRGDLHARRQALSIVQEKDVVHKVFEKAAERYGSTAGGYTRLVKIGPRPGDAADMTLVELIGSEAEAKTKKKAKKKATAKAAPAKKKAASGSASKAKATEETAGEEPTAEAKPKRAPRKKAAEALAPAEKPEPEKGSAEKSE
ncbi:MAG: 50S ribosomal protein L17 [Desulfobacterales bacterium]|nr:50S ribosomal protein L17 [Desulfobacterales bacterium]